MVDGVFSLAGAPGTGRRFFYPLDWRRSRAQACMAACFREKLRENRCRRGVHGEPATSGRPIKPQAVLSAAGAQAASRGYVGENMVRYASQSRSSVRNRSQSLAGSAGHSLAFGAWAVMAAGERKKPSLNPLPLRWGFYARKMIWSLLAVAALHGDPSTLYAADAAPASPAEAREAVPELTPRAARAADVPELVVGTRSFVVTVKPVDEQSRDAKTAELYVTRFPDKGWVLDGQCEVGFENSGPVFSRTVTVPTDGAYYFTSRGVDAVGSAPAPKAGERAQVKVIADTTPPYIKITAPTPGRVLRAGENIRLEWLARDANLEQQPIALEYTIDAGRSWQLVGGKLPNTGHHFWQVPLEGSELMLRASCVDRAGNRSTDEPGTVWRIVPQPKPEIALGRERIPATTGAQPPAAMPAAEVTVKEAPKPAAADAFAPELKDPRKPSKNPALDANNGEIPTVVTNPAEGRAAYIAYLMGGNLVRQGRLKDSLRYYRTAVDIDPNFDEAWNDMALVFKNLGAFAKADACIVKSLAIEPESIRYHNTRAGIYQSAGFEILRDPASGEESLARANDLILFAVKTYGKAVDLGLKQGRLAECAETYFHLGEICYFGNQDPRGARQYWVKVLDLHTPTPELDEVIFDKDTPQERLTRTIYEKNTELFVDLRTWQSWAREYLTQLNQLEAGAAVPTAPFTSSYFQRFANPRLGMNSVAGGSLPTGGASAEAYGLNPSGAYAGAGCPITGAANAVAPVQNMGQAAGQGGGTPWYYDANGNPVSAPVNRVVSSAQPQAVDARQQFLRTGQCTAGAVNQANPYTQVMPGNTRPTYGARSMQADQADMQNRSLPPQGAWNNGSYGSAPDYTYRVSGSY